MTALQFPQSATPDTPEVADLKRRLLDRVKRNPSRPAGAVLRDEGVVPEKTAKVKVTTTHPFVFEVTVFPSALNGKTEDEQKVVLSGLIGPLTLTSAVGTTQVTVPPEAIVAMEVLPEPEKPEEDERFRWLRVSGKSGKSRLSHAYRVSDLDDRVGQRYVYPLCGNADRVIISQQQVDYGESHSADAEDCNRCHARIAELRDVDVDALSQTLN